MKKLIFACALLAGCGSDEEPCDPTVPNTICTIAGSGKQGYDRNTLAIEAALYVPQDTAVSPDGEVWILDFNNYLVRRIRPDGTLQRMVGNGDLGDSPPDGTRAMPALDATFNHTSDLFFANGYLYLAAWHNSRIKRVDLSTMMLENFAGRGRRTYYDGDGGPRLDASLDLPSSIALAPNGDVVIMDQANQVVRKVDADGKITRIAGTCVLDDIVACAPGVAPVACNGDTNKTTCGDPNDCGTERACVPGYGGDGGPAIDARIAQPYGQAADPAGRIVYDKLGNLYIADSENNRIRKVDTAGIITTVAGTGQRGYSGDDGPAVDAQINRPIDVEVDDAGNVYFTDVYNNCIRRIDADGTMRRVAGKCKAYPAGAGFSGDGGPPLEAKLDRPYGIDLEGGKLYISDSYNNRIRVVNLP